MTDAMSLKLTEVHEMNVNLNLKLLGYSVCNLVLIPEYE
ncbi:F-box protein [Corchorus olitorius]|uniref:F-box protein n=1 Tax=Corchorus olitorius TaxID=93759 RepID=A0A1R3GYF5_9ROSI|nr:F-box protein [Corchorus olitorius]